MFILMDVFPFYEERSVVGRRLRKIGHRPRQIHLRK